MLFQLALHYFKNGDVEVSESGIYVTGKVQAGVELVDTSGSGIVWRPGGEGAAAFGRRGIIDGGGDWLDQRS